MHPDYKHLTTFLTPWGRYRYKVAPQGHLVSGDGFNERYDSITSEFKRKERCVDDTVMWADNIEDSFLQTCQYLDLCARNGIILNPEKFQARDLLLAQQLGGLLGILDILKHCRLHIKGAIREYQTQLINQTVVVMDGVYRRARLEEMVYKVRG